MSARITPLRQKEPPRKPKADDVAFKLTGGRRRLVE